MTRGNSSPSLDSKVAVCVSIAGGAMMCGNSSGGSGGGSGGGGGGDGSINHRPIWLQGDMIIQTDVVGNNHFVRILDSTETLVDYGDGEFYTEYVNTPIVGRQVSWSWDLTVPYGDIVIQNQPTQTINSDTDVLIFTVIENPQQPFFELSGTITATVDGYTVSRNVFYGAM